MLIQSRILLAGTAAVLALSACNNSTTSGSAAPSKDAVAATVNGVAISNSRVEMLLKQRAGQGAPETPEMRKQVIDQLVMPLILSQEAEKKGLDKNQETLDQIDLNRQNVLARAFVQDYMKNNPVTDEQIKAEYDKVKAEMSGNEYKARHILVKTEAEAKDIISKLKRDPKVFADLAKEKSMDPGSKVNGGDLGWFDPRSMVPEFGAAVAKLEKGKFTEEPVKSQFGFHVIMLEDSRPKEFPPMEQVKEQLKNQVQQKSFEKLIEDMKAKAKIDIVAAPAAAAPAASAPAASAPAAATPAASAPAPAASAPAASADTKK